jgi:hypothetical protein
MSVIQRSAAAIVVVLAAAVLITGCGSSEGSATGGSHSAGHEVAQRKREPSAEAAKKAKAEAILQRLRPCEQVDDATTAMTTAVSAAVKSGASEAAYIEAAESVETLRGKLAALASKVQAPQSAQLQESRRFLLKVGTLVEAFKTHDLALAQEELSGYRAGMVELTEHIKAACS